MKLQRNVLKTIWDTWFAAFILNTIKGYIKTKFKSLLPIFLSSGLLDLPGRKTSLLTLLVIPHYKEKDVQMLNISPCSLYYNNNDEDDDDEDEND